jgi:hypothetical protein
MERVQTGMTSRNLENDKWRKRTWMKGEQIAMTSNIKNQIKGETERG